MAPLICTQCASPVSPLEVTCLGCGTLVVNGQNTRQLAETPLAAPDRDPPAPPAGQRSESSAPAKPSQVELACPHCGTAAGDPAALVCVSCLREFSGPTDVASDDDSEDVDSDEDVLTRTRRDTPAASVSLEVKNHKVPLPPSARVLIGRDRSSPACDALAPYENVSRFHAEIHRDPSGLWITDLGSTNGSFLDGRRLAPGERLPLTDGARLRLAANVETTIRVDSSGGAGGTR